MSARIRVAALAWFPRSKCTIFLSYSWWVFEESSSYIGSVTIQSNSSASATVEVPSDAEGQNIHVILELSDNGSPSLTAYRRVILNVQ